MDKVAAQIAALGVPGLVLLVAMSATGYAGAAALTTALAALGPFGMLGGLVLLGGLALVSKALTEYGFEEVYKAVVRELHEKGIDDTEILRQIQTYPISGDLKLKLKDRIRSHGERENSDLMP